MGEEYLVRGATLRCTMGTATSKLNLPVCHGVYCTGKPMMHMMDYIPMVNIMPFGSCVVLQGAPCVPVTVPWMIPNMTFHLTGHIPAITTKSFCVCLLGGMISPQDSGQGVIQVKLNGPVERAGAKSNNKASSEDSEELLTYDEKNATLNETTTKMDIKYDYSSIVSLQNTENFTDKALQHIFNGEVNKKGKATGYHYENIEGTLGNIITGTATIPNSQGIYSAKVEVNGIPKAANGGFSSFFPKEMSPQQIVDAINEAYDNRTLKIGNEYYGYSNEFKITLYLDKSNKIISAFPKI